MTLFGLFCAALVAWLVHNWSSPWAALLVFPGYILGMLLAATVMGLYEGLRGRRDANYESWRRRWH